MVVTRWFRMVVVAMLWSDCVGPVGKMKLWCSEVTKVPIASACNHDYVLLLMPMKVIVEVVLEVMLEDVIYVDDLLKYVRPSSSTCIFYSSFTHAFFTFTSSPEVNLEDCVCLRVCVYFTFKCVA
jgi:hypothetical protein